MPQSPSRNRVVIHEPELKLISRKLDFLLFVLAPLLARVRLTPLGDPSMTPL